MDRDLSVGLHFMANTDTGIPPTPTSPHTPK